MSTPNINAVLKMTKDYLDGKMDHIDYELDFPYEVEQRYRRMCREDAEYCSTSLGTAGISSIPVRPAKPSPAPAGSSETERKLGFQLRSSIILLKNHMRKSTLSVNPGA